jgi:polyhydroxybutyrate depolymerase
VGKTIVATLLVLALAAHARATLDHGDFRATLDVDGRPRDYIVHVPRLPHRKHPRPVALVFYLPADGMTARQAATATGLSKFSDRDQFLVAYLDATRQPNDRRSGGRWNGGACTGGPTAPCGGRAFDGGPAHAAGVDDVAYVRAVIDDLGRQFPIDPRRIYAIGHTEGAIMASRLACELGDRIAAVTIAEGAIEVPCDHPARAVPVLLYHALDDAIVPYDGNKEFPPVAYTFDAWRTIDGCRGRTLTRPRTRFIVETSRPCRGDSQVRLYTIKQGGNGWLLHAPAFVWQRVAWRFFRGHPLR